MSLYGQDAELQLLRKLLARLDCRTIIDIGAERGSWVEGMLHAGAADIYAFDPHPDNASAMRHRFARDPRVSVCEYAISDTNGSGELQVSTSPDGTPLSFGHTFLKRDDTDEITWRNTLTVRRHSLQSLVEAGELPIKVGILKIDTEGHDLAVVRGMGELEADVVMVEHWSDLPHGLGVCPWSTQDMVTALGERGFSHFAFMIHRDEFVTIKWDDGDVERGAMGNLVFLHDSKLDRLLPDVLDCAGSLAERAVSVGQTYVRVANERLAIIAELKQAADERLALVVDLAGTAEERLQALEITQAQVKAQDLELKALGHESR